MTIKLYILSSLYFCKTYTCIKNKLAEPRKHKKKNHLRSSRLAFLLTKEPAFISEKRKVGYVHLLSIKRQVFILYPHFPNVVTAKGKYMIHCM